jgi:hypothetical protein
MTQIKTVFAALLTVGLVWFVTPMLAHATEADTAEDPAKPKFEAVDTNQDEVITPSEAEGTWLAQVFGDVDANQDGLINRTEYESAMG